MTYYKLGPDRRSLVECVDVTEWADWFSVRENPTVERTVFPDKTTVGTLCIGVEPVEGMGVFSTGVLTLSDKGGYTLVREERTRTFDDALRAHEEAVEWVKAGMPM